MRESEATLLLLDGMTEHLSSDPGLTVKEAWEIMMYKQPKLRNFLWDVDGLAVTLKGTLARLERERNAPHFEILSISHERMIVNMVARVMRKKGAKLDDAFRMVRDQMIKEEPRLKHASADWDRMQERLWDMTQTGAFPVDGENTGRKKETCIMEIANDDYRVGGLRVEAGSRVYYTFEEGVKVIHYIER